MTVASLPDATPARLAPAVDEDETSAGPGTAKGFSAALHARVAQGDREERHPRRPGAGAVGAVNPHVQPPLLLGDLGLAGAGAGAGADARAAAAAAPVAYPSANPVTVVNPPSSGTLTIPDAARARYREAVTFVTTQAALRRGAVSELDLPELGRVVIRAQRGPGGAVDVHITVERPETTAILQASAASMAADLVGANVPVGQIQIETMAAAAAPEDRGAPADDIRRARSASGNANSEKDTSSPGGKRRVRIVL